VQATDPKLPRFLREVRDKSDDWRLDDRAISCRAHEVPPAVMDAVWPDWKAWRVSCFALGCDHERTVEVRLCDERTQTRLLECTVTARPEPAVVLFAFRFGPAAALRVAVLDHDGLHVLIEQAIDRSELPSTSALENAELTYMGGRYAPGTDGFGYAYYAIDEDLETSLTVWSWNGEASHWLALTSAQTSRDRPGAHRTYNAVDDALDSPLRDQPIASWPEPVWALTVSAVKK
jgi:hypothetical protein